MASEPGPSGNILSLSGRSIFTDFSSRGAARAAKAIDATPNRMTAGRNLRKHRVILRQAATISTDSTTLRMKPAGFQFGVSGCATPLLLVQRLSKLYLPGEGGVNCVCHCRNPYLPSSFPSVVGRQLLPSSIETSTLATPLSPPNAMPRRVVGAAAFTLSPEAIFVTNDRGTIRFIGTIFTSVWPGLILACGVSGMV